MVGAVGMAGVIRVVGVVGVVGVVVPPSSKLEPACEVRVELDKTRFMAVRIHV